MRRDYACGVCGLTDVEVGKQCQCGGKHFMDVLSSGFPPDPEAPTVRPPNYEGDGRKPTVRPGEKKPGRPTHDEIYEQSPLSKWTARLYGKVRSAPEKAVLSGNAVVALFDVLDAAAHWRDEKQSKRTTTRLLIALEALERMVER